MIGKINLTKKALKKFCKNYNYLILTTSKDIVFNSIEPITEAKETDITFCRFTDNKGMSWAQESKAGLIFLPNEFQSIADLINVDTKIFCNYPRLGLLNLIEQFWVDPNKTLSQNSTCSIHRTVKIGKNVLIGDYSVIGENVKIGNNCIIGSNTVVEHCIIGNNCKIGNNVSIGGEGFGFEDISETNEIKTFPHIGIVKIGNNVRVGSSTCIDRASIGSTTISNNVKIDNLVHISHNVFIGQNSKIVAMTIIGGSTSIGQNTWVAPGSAIRDWVKVGNDVLVGLGAVVTKNIVDNLAVVGNPAKPILKTTDRYRG